MARQIVTEKQNDPVEKHRSDTLYHGSHQGDLGTTQNPDG